MPKVSIEGSKLGGVSCSAGIGAVGSSAVADAFRHEVRMAGAGMVVSSSEIDSV